MKYTILVGSPNRNGNTAAMLRPFMEENQEMGIEQDVIWLYEREIKPCTEEAYLDVPVSGEQKDDFDAIFNSVQTSDVLIFATPIHSWYCSGPMKNVMDRLICANGLKKNKDSHNSPFWMKQVATLTTCGYPTADGADLWEEGLKRWCNHGDMDYLGMMSLRDKGDPAKLLDEKSEFDVRDFAHALFIMVGHSL